MPGSNQDSATGSKTEKTSHLHTANRRKAGQPGERCSWSPFMFRLLFGIQYVFHLYSKRLLYQGGLITSSRRASRGLRRDRGRPLCLPKWRICLRRCWLLDQGSQVEWFVCLCLRTKWHVECMLVSQKLANCQTNISSSISLSNRVIGDCILSLQVSPIGSCHVWQRK